MSSPHRKRRGGPATAFLPPLTAGALVRLTCLGDPWLRRYHGLFGRVVRSEGAVVDVALSDGRVVSFWRQEVQMLPGIPGKTNDRTAAGDEYLSCNPSVAGFSLQAERQKASLTQHELAAAMAVTVQRVSQIEGQLSVLPQTAARYARAIRTAMAGRVA
jgi:DNA-binding transcriptional regulator YiaG